MSYKKHRDYFIARLAAIQFMENGSFEFEGDANITGKFILENPIIDNENPAVSDQFYPTRTWTIKIAFKGSDNKAVVEEYNRMQIRIDQFLKEVCNPANFQASSFEIRNLTFLNMNTETSEDLIQFNLSFTVEDLLTYA